MVVICLLMLILKRLADLKCYLAQLEAHLNELAVLSVSFSQWSLDTSNTDDPPTASYYFIPSLLGLDYNWNTTNNH